MRIAFFYFIYSYFSICSWQASSSTLGDAWIFLLIPAFAIQWKPFTGGNSKLWKILTSLSLLLSISIPSIASLPQTKTLIIKSFVFFTGNANPLYQVYQWQDLQKEIENQQNIKITTTPYFKDFPIPECDNSYHLASLRWYWTAQMAFYFKNQPRIFNFDFSNSSFYTWRDPIYKLAGCKFIVIGSQNHFNQDELNNVMDIIDIKKFSLFPYNDNNIVIIKGTLKEKDKLIEVYKKTKSEIRY